MILFCSCDLLSQNSLLPLCFLRLHSITSPSIFVGTGALTDWFGKCVRKGWTLPLEEQPLLFIPAHRYFLNTLLPVLPVMLANHAEHNHSCSGHWERVSWVSNCHEPTLRSFRHVLPKPCRHHKLKTYETNVIMSVLLIFPQKTPPSTCSWDSSFRERQHHSCSSQMEKLGVILGSFYAFHEVHFLNTFSVLLYLLPLCHCCDSDFHYFSYWNLETSQHLGVLPLFLSRSFSSSTLLQCCILNETLTKKSNEIEVS